MSKENELCGQCGIRISGGVCQCVSVLESRVAELESELELMRKTFRRSLLEWMRVWRATGKTRAEATKNALAAFEESLK